MVYTPVMAQKSAASARTYARGVSREWRVYAEGVNHNVRFREGSPSLVLQQVHSRDPRMTTTG